MKKRADGRYCKHVPVGYNPDGTRKFKTVYGKTIREVENREREVRNKIASGIKVIEDATTVAEWGIRWLSVYKADVARSTYAMYENCLRNHIIPTIGAIYVSKLKAIQIQEVINKYIRGGHVRTAEIYKLTIKQILKQAVEQGLVSRDVCSGLSKIKSNREEKRVLTNFEKRCISMTEYTDRERVFINLLYYTGIRRGEALALTTGDIDRKTRMLRINKSLDISDNQPVVKVPKSKSGYRNIPIPDNLYEELMTYIKKQKSINLFTMKNGEVLSRSSFRKMWESIIKKTKETAERLSSEKPQCISVYTNKTISFTPHTFRHTYATNLYYAGIDIKRCQYLLGHSSIEMTLKVYTHLNNKSDDGSVDKINKYFGNMKEIC